MQNTSAQSNKRTRDTMKTMTHLKAGDVAGDMAAEAAQAAKERAATMQGIKDNISKAAQQVSSSQAKTADSTMRSFLTFLGG
jgi:hypothetical protein